MARAVEVTRLELGPEDLRREAARAKDARAARRMLAIALVLEGAERTTAARSCGMDRQTLRDWVHRYNGEGLAGLANRGGQGRKPLLSPEQKARLAAVVEAGPDPAVHGVCAGGAWTCGTGRRRSSRSGCTSARWASS